ncbi:Ig-like domain-containing protein, partial [Bosea sp. CER48]|uniref:Ig-like domain-containing protein n=1 Tax=Bosea sp. CER48 TaxID=3377035 RepID=UPI003808EFBB
FEIAVSDPQGNTILVPVSFDVTPVDNDPPIADPSPLVVTEDTPATAHLNAYDPDGGVLSYSVSAPPAHGTVVINADGSYTYTPNPDFFGPDSFEITITDSSGATLVVPIGFSVAPANDPPSANPPLLVVPEDGSATGTLNASDPDGDPLGYALATPPAHGTVVLNGDGTYIYTPNPDYFGADSFSVTISDGQGGVIVVPVNVSVTGVNDPPVANPPPLVVTEDTPATGTLGASDPDGDQLTFTLNTPPTNGTVVLNPDGTYTYRPNPSFNGSDGFSVSISDGNGNVILVPVSVFVAAVDDPPVGSDLAITLPEDGSFASRLPPASDPEGQPVGYALGRPPGFGSAAVNADGSFAYVPAPNFFGTDSFTYVISDGTSTSVHTVTITVTPVNDAPVAANDAIAIRQDTPAILPVMLNDGDVDGDPLTIIGAEASVGTVSINADGTLNYQPPGGFIGTATITYTISDG